MQPTTPLPQTRRTRLRWWMVPLCLLACWLAWWGVAYWLSPNPAWSIPLPHNRQYDHIRESPDQQFLLCTDMLFSPNRRRIAPQGMTLLDTATGKVLHTISVENVEQIAGIDHPLFQGDTVSWIKSHGLGNGIRSYRLHRWHFREGRFSTSEKVWSGYHLLSYRPDKSNIVVFQHLVPPSILRLGYLDNPYFSMALQMLYRLSHLPQFYWYESWELPTGTETEPRFLARWAIPNRGWENLRVTEDGKWAIFPEPIGNDYQATQRAKATGKESFSGVELFELYRSRHKELLVYNTRTGKVQYRYSDQAAYHYVTHSTQNYFVMQAYYPGPDSKATLTEINSAKLDDNKYSRLFLQADELFRIDEHGITKLQRSPALLHAHLGDRLYCSGHRLQAFQHPSSHLSELAIDGNELKIKQALTLPNERIIYLLPLGNQAIVYHEGRIIPEILTRWLANSPKLLKWAEKIWQTLQPQVQFSIVDSTGNNIREQAFTYELLSNLDASHLYCVENKNREAEYTLHAYTLPMKLHSPWWSRVAGLLPLLLLLAYCLRTNHPRRLAGG